MRLVHVEEIDKEVGEKGATMGRISIALTRNAQATHETCDELILDIGLRHNTWAAPQVCHFLPLAVPWVISPWGELRHDDINAHGRERLTLHFTDEQKQTTSRQGTVTAAVPEGRLANGRTDTQVSPGQPSSAQWLTANANTPPRHKCRRRSRVMITMA